MTDCWRKIGGEWLIQEAPFIDEWSEEDYHTLVSCLRNTVRTGGLVLGAFHQGWLKGFVSVEAGLFGQEQEYLDLSSLHVSEEMRRAGIEPGFISGSTAVGSRTWREKALYLISFGGRRSPFTARWALWKQRNITVGM